MFLSILVLVIMPQSLYPQLRRLEDDDLNKIDFSDLDSSLKLQNEAHFLRTGNRAKCLPTKTEGKQEGCRAKSAHHVKPAPRKSSNPHSRGVRSSPRDRDSESDSDSDVRPIHRNYLHHGRRSRVLSQSEAAGCGHGCRGNSLTVDEDSQSQCSDVLWRDFEQHIRCIDTDSVSFQAKELAKKSSQPFQEVMTELEEERQKKLLRKKSIKDRISMVGKMQKFKMRAMVELAKDAEEIAEEEEETEPRQLKHSEMSTGKKAWRLLSQRVKEKALEENRNKSMGGWNLIALTVKRLSDTEKARQDLYEKYIYKQDAWTEGFVNYPKAFLERRAVRNNRNKFSRSFRGTTRPKSSHPALQSTSVTFNRTGDNNRNRIDSSTRTLVNRTRRPHSSIA